jgi:hypothetical protein
MGVLNRKKAGGGAAAGPGAEFFNAAEASQLNTLLRGEGDPEAKPENGPDDSKDPGAATEPTVRARVPRASPRFPARGDPAAFVEIRAFPEPPREPRPALVVRNLSNCRRREHADWVKFFRPRRGPNASLTAFVPSLPPVTTRSEPDLRRRPSPSRERGRQGQSR